MAKLLSRGRSGDVIREPRSVTGSYLSGKSEIAIPDQRRDANGQSLDVIGAAHNNLKDIDVRDPAGHVCLRDGRLRLWQEFAGQRHSGRGPAPRSESAAKVNPGQHDRIEGLEHLDKLIAIDQSPIGRTPRSNPGTYIKVFDDIRNLFAQLPESKRRGYKPGRFSFNVEGGRCEACEGNGSNRLEMDFLADVWVTCPVCEGHRYNRETLQVQFKDKSIAEVLEMDVQQALELFENIPKVSHKLQTLHDVGLDYLKLGQPSPTLSGGEAQRIKLARELVKKSTGQTLYLLDEPTTGLALCRHPAAAESAARLRRRRQHGAGRRAQSGRDQDGRLDHRPGAGRRRSRWADRGRRHARSRSPRDPDSYTGQALADALSATQGPTARKSKQCDAHGGEAASKAASWTRQIRVQGAQQHNLKCVDVEMQRDAMTVFCGPSGSGKSSLAMDTIYAEGQRRYVESLSAYARQFVSQMQKPQLDHIDGLSPAIAIEQKNLGNTPRSTVGTVTEIYDYLRILMARLGQPYLSGLRCRHRHADGRRNRRQDPAMHPHGNEAVSDGAGGSRRGAGLRVAVGARLRAPATCGSAWTVETYSVDQPPTIDRRRKHRVEVVIDRIVVDAKRRSRIADSVENALALGEACCTSPIDRDDVDEASWRDGASQPAFLACDRCGRSFERLTPHNFSFNSPLGWCPACRGLGDPDRCQSGRAAARSPS